MSGTDPDVLPVADARRERVDGWGWVVLGLAAVIVGAVAGVLWGVLAPGVRGVVAEIGAAVSLPTAVDIRFDAVAVFVCVMVVAGVIVGLLGWSVRSLRGVAGVLTTVVSAVVTSAVAMWIGGLVAHARYPGPGPHREVGQFYTSSPALWMPPAHLGPIPAPWALVVIAPLAAVIAYLVATLSSPYPDLGRGDDPHSD
ncbi:DUF2567 domain-containing protein [Williamsia sterculiae]|uniref:DUF2567 domain-containing protein n=1 Tax=Williamsia sterculiae TaxID=1344003 RepID=A0A1N7H5Y1_9NOCA|nr:DUF2567 domain-containing protein [Williamsia sterculiae]SIS20277.1 Protein of unknown function [Williamsia sterculiae]